MTKALAPGDKVLLIDGKQRRYLTTLVEGGQFHTHAGFVNHEDIIGQAEGFAAKMTSGATYIAVRPTLSDYILKMPRGAQVIYPKDLGAILMLADISSGVKVLEAGVGSGALSMAMLRSGATVVGYEIRSDFAAKALTNVASFVGVEETSKRYRIEERDIYEGIDEHDLDRIVLDLPEPWQVVKHAEESLSLGGILVSYLPTIGQVAHLRETLANSRFSMAETQEVLVRTWHVEGQSVRPDHRMVAHTGFLTHARLLKP